MIKTYKHFGVGDSIELRFDDYTDTSDKKVDILMRTIHNTMADIPQMQWSYSIDGQISDIQSFHFQRTLEYQKLATVYVGLALTFGFHLYATPNSGPFRDITSEDFSINLFTNSTVKTYSIKDEGVWKRAVPYVRVDGVWTPAQVFIMDNSEWIEAEQRRM